MIAALFVQRGGAYYGIPDVDPWDESRDARLYPGPHPVVAHPPCARWCRLAGLVEARWGHKRGDDGGCFASALASVRRWSGVLEHPAYSDAWAAHGLNPPITGGGWTAADFEGGWTCEVSQAHYGHRARKLTWLYACRIPLPSLRWGSPAGEMAWVSWCNNHNPTGKVVERLGKQQRNATPPEFRETLLAMARSAALKE
jgi:hypothetical protein